MIRNQNGVVEHLGSTCYIRNESIQVMSDVWEYCLVAHSISDEGHLTQTYLWDDAEGKPKYEVEVDVTEEAFERFWNWRYNHELDQLMRKAEEDSFNPAVKGRTVRIVRGRKGKDIEGKVVAVTESVYHAGYRSSIEYKLGIALTDRKKIVEKNGRQYENYADVLWVWARNCEVVNPETPSRESFDREACKVADWQLQSLRNSIRDYWIANGKKYYPFKRAA